MGDPNSIVLLTMVYLITGIAITGYDFSAPPIDKKGYVIQKNYKVATVIFFLWPIAVLHEAYYEHKARKPYARYLIGVAALFIGIYMWAKLMYLICFSMINIEFMAFIATSIAMLFGSPLITKIAMPSHRSRRRIL
jgi:hypothetical protein